jgi:hypothetical protein
MIWNKTSVAVKAQRDVLDKPLRTRNHRNLYKTLDIAMINGQVVYSMKDVPGNAYEIVPNGFGLWIF